MIMKISRKIHTGVVVGALVLAGCSSYRPIVDMQGIDEAQYEQDLAECQSYAEQVSPVQDAATHAVIGAAIGAAFGAIAGAWGGDAGTGAAIGASYGGAGGALQGGAGGASSQKSIIRRCMTGRGYSVLN